MRSPNPCASALSYIKRNADKSASAKPTESNTVTSVADVRVVACPVKTCHSSVTGKSAGIQSLLGEPRVVALHDTNGRWDLWAELEVSSMVELSQLLERMRLISGIHP